MKKIFLSILFTVASLFTFGQSNDCATATVMDLSSGNACETGTTLNATSDNILYGACNAASVNEVWYTYVSNGADNQFTIDPQGMTDAEIVIYTGGCGDFLELCLTETGGTTLDVGWGIPAGTQVWIAVATNGGTEGDFELCIESNPPAPTGGNLCSSAIPICDVSSTISVDMATTGASGAFPSCFGGGANNDVFIEFTVLQTGTFEWQASPSDPGIELDWAMYDITNGCPGTEVDCNYNWDGAGSNANGASSNPPNGPTGAEFNAPLTVVAGNTYLILVDYYTLGAQGLMDFSVTGGTAVIAPEADFTISPTNIQCATTVDITITDNSIGAPDWDFGNGNTYTGNNPPVQTYPASGTYAITATINGACTSTMTEFVEVYGPLVSVPAFTDETCIGDCDGDASVIVTGGSGTYNYFWTPNGETTTDISGLCSGPFSVTVSDAICGTSVTEDYIIGGANCATCLLTNMTSLTSACDPATDTYTTSGIVEFTDPPLTGTLTVSDCNGNQQVFTAPFTSPINYNLTGQTADGLACDITAVFSDDVTCTQTLNPTAPICLCNMDNFFASIGSCDGVLNTFQVTGDMAFTSSPATGTLIVEVDNGTTVYDTIINPPFTSPQTYSISGIPADGSGITVTVYFSADPTCTATLSSNAPADCSCAAEIGTFTTTIAGDGLNNYVLCFGDQVNIASNGDYVVPGDANQPGTAVYDPGMGYLIYSCPPTIGLAPSPTEDVTDDPCLIGFATAGEILNNTNTTGDVPWTGVYANSTVYYVPITMYSLTDMFYSVTNTIIPCYDLGAPIAVQYLPQVIGTPTEDCFAGTVTVLVSGGLPAIDGSLFTGSNLVPGSASFTNGTAADGGSILVSGLLDGDNYSFDITDANGCPITISGTFTGVPVANAGTDATSCTLSYTLNPTVSFGIGTWTGPAGATFTPNANTANATVTVPGEGAYSFTWTEDNGGGCLTTDVVAINFSNLSQTFVENCPSTLTSTVTGGYIGTTGFNTASNLVPATAFFVNTTAANGATIVVDGLATGDMYSFDITDDNGCVVTVSGGPYVGTPVAIAGPDDVSCVLNYTLAATASFGIGTWSGPAGVTFTPNANDANATVTVPSEGSYTFTWTEDGGAGCLSSDDVVISFSNMSQTFVEDCQGPTVTATILGAFTGTSGVVSASNLLPGNASFVNATAPNGGDIVINGLLEGDMYSFDITDDNGCVITVSGGPFVAVPIANAGTDDDVCGLTYALAPTVSYGVGTWTGTGVTFTPNANTPVATANVSAAGAYTFTWTEDNGNGCVSADDVVIQFSDLSFVDVVVQSTCGNADGEILLTASNGITPYSYSIDGGATFTNTTGNFTGLLAATYDVAVQDALGCIVTGTVSVTDQGGPVINSVTPISPLCNGVCDGSLSIDVTGATQFSIDGGTTFQGVNIFTNLCAGNYDIMVENAIGCQASATTIISDPAIVSYTVAITNLACTNQCEGTIDVSAGGGTGTLEYSMDNGVTYQLGNTFNNLCAGNYDVVVQDANGCQANSAEIVTEPAPMAMTLGITNPLCNSSCDGLINSIPTGGDGNYTYTWSNGQSLPLILNLCAGSYSLNIEDGNGCFIDTTVTLVGPAAAVITNVIEVDESCPGMCDGTLEVVATNVTQYSIDGVSFGPGSIFTNLCSGTYTVYAQDVNGCSTTAPAEVSSPIVVGVSATATSPICIGGSSFLDGTTTGGTQPFTYQWSDNSGAAVFITEDGNVSPVLDEVYTFTATDANGCSAATNVLVQVNDPLSLSVFGDTPICEGSLSSLSALASGGDGGPYTYTWDQGLGVGQNQSVFPTQTTVYTVTVTDGCETPPISDQVTVTVNTVPAISFTGDQLSGCLPVTTNFSDNLVPAGSSCLWNFGDGGTSTQCGNPSYVFTQPGCWDVTLTITTAEGCVETVTIPNYVCVFAYPTADFTFGPQPTTVMHPTIDFDNLSSNADLYNWTFDVGGLEDQSTVENPQYTFPSANPGTYEVCLEANTLEGCSDVICQNVVIDEEFIIYVPNAFTPGGGDLINNEFKPIVKGEDPLKYSFMVFNRWGELIFETSHSSEGWDGTYKGLMSQQDVYVWKVTCIDASSKNPHEYIGHVTLLK
jgi:large repetitive protein